MWQSLRTKTNNCHILHDRLTIRVCMTTAAQPWMLRVASIQNHTQAQSHCNVRDCTAYTHLGYMPSWDVAYRPGEAYIAWVRQLPSPTTPIRTALSLKLGGHHTGQQLHRKCMLAERPSREGLMRQRTCQHPSEPTCPLRPTWSKMGPAMLCTPSDPHDLATCPQCLCGCAGFICSSF